MEQAIVAPGKVTGYLLSATHPNGRHKARFFTSFGFAVDAWQQLEQALIQQACDHEVTKSEPSPFGMRYVIEGKIVSPDGRNPSIRSIWFIESNEAAPYFVTAYPLRENANDSRV